MSLAITVRNTRTDVVFADKKGAYILQRLVWFVLNSQHKTKTFDDLVSIVHWACSNIVHVSSSDIARMHRFGAEGAPYTHSRYRLTSAIWPSASSRDLSWLMVLHGTDSWLATCV